MSSFSVYFNLGVRHILDLAGYDHILFIVALSALYILRDWRKVLVLVTAFTIGHSITLALSTFNVMPFKAEFIEFLIPVTIFITAFSNLFKKEQEFYETKKFQLNYFYALFFGLIHGLGFSSYLKSLLGHSTNVVTQLFAFNIGLEVGQIVVVLCFLIAAFIFINLFGVKRRDWMMIISSAVAGVALTMIIHNWYWA